MRAAPPLPTLLALLTLSVLVPLTSVSLVGTPFSERAKTVPPSDRAFKLDLISRLESAPELVVLGSSRSKGAEPSYLRRLTGHSVFNAGVRGGTAADAWVMTRFLADCVSPTVRRYLWFVDIGIATNGVNPDLEADTRSRAYLGLGGDPGHREACSRRALDPRNTYGPDGSGTKNTGRAAQNPDFPEKLAKLVASVRAHPAALSGNLNPLRYVWFERTLAFMNAHGARPVIVLNPIHPEIFAAMSKVGFRARNTARRYLTQLHERFDFVVVDAQDIRAWGGSADDFWDPVHINDANMRRLLRYVVSHSDGAL